MNQGKKRVSFVLLFSLATLLLFGVAGTVYAQSYQIVTLTPSSESVAQGGTVDVTFTYNTSDNRDDLTGFGAMLCFDSSALTYQSYTGIKAENLLSLPSVKVYDDTNDQCGFGATGKKIPLVYKEKDGVKFTSAGLPADLMKFTFQAANTDITTTLKSIGTINAAGYETQNGSATIKVGAPPVGATAQTIAQADGTLWLTPNLVIIDVADAAAYAAGRITGAQALADVDLASIPQETPILVYCRDAANAKAEADKLVAAPNSFTNVYYLDDTFENWVAAVNPVKVEYKLTLTIAGSGNGTVVDPVGNQYAPEDWYVKGTTVNLTGKPKAGSIFDGFSNGGKDPVDVVMNASTDVTATFSLDGTCDAAPVITATPRTGAESLTVDFNSAGSTGTNPTWDYGDGETFQGATATHTYAAADTYTVKLTTTGTGGCTVVATKDVTVTPPAVVEYELTVNAAAGGTAAANPAQATYAAGTVVNITATPAEGYQFVNWTGDVVANANVAATTVTMDADKTVTANFELIPADEYTLTVNASAGGTAVAIPAQATYAAGTVVTVKATENAGYKFVNWTGDAVANATVLETTITMDANKTVTANFEIPITCSATISGPSTVKLNEAVTFTAVVNAPGATITNYNWTMGDGTVIEGADKSSVTHTYTSGTSANLFLAVTTDLGAACNPSAGWSVTLTSDLTPDGDGDCNGVVDIYDALLAAIINVGNPDNITICDVDMLDVDQNNVVDINDALAIALYDVGLDCNCVLDPQP